jgi:hypothetical protein
MKLSSHLKKPKKKGIQINTDIPKDPLPASKQVLLQTMHRMAIPDI